MDMIELRADSEYFKPFTKEQASVLTKSQLIELLMMERDMRLQAQTQIFKTQGQYIKLVKSVFLPRSEKTKKKRPKKKSSKKRSDYSKSPSDRYPNALVMDCEVSIEGDVICDHCTHEMKDSGLRDTSEVITVVPVEFKIERHHHVQYKCPHCSYLKTTPRVPRIKPGSSYSDEMIIDVAISKYCDLLPINRYAAMARRESMMNIPPNTLIELTHYLAMFTADIVKIIKEEVLSSNVLRADETPHKMFEHFKKNWYLWGFSSDKAAYFECHPSRSGDVAAAILKDSGCKYLMSDVYSGYSKAIKIANDERVIDKLDDKITEIFCNAHARRKFKAFEDYEDFQFILRCYSLIYMIEKSEILKRKWQIICFQLIQKKCEGVLKKCSVKSEIYKAANYFLKNYEGLTLFTRVVEQRLPIDNNAQERLLRSAVIGRKTWFGTHSITGAQTAAAIFTIIESCKLNKIDPRKYLQMMTKHIHQKKKIISPSQAAKDFPQIAWQGSPPRKTG